MLTNLLILAFILAMAYWWALQGLFSAFLHLVLVVVAGSLAFALWEPLVYNFGMSMQPQYAWGLWLLGPFVLLLIVLRVLSDRLVRKNVQFPDLVNKLVGGLCGVVSGTLTAGITVIGLGFLPLPSNLGGYEPLVVSADGTVAPSGSELWVPVDRLAGRFFATAAYNGFYSPTPLPEYQPELARAASLYRLRYDENSAVVAVLDSVSVPRAAVASTPVEELDATVTPLIASASGNRSQQHGFQLVAVETAWLQKAGTYDSDGALRVPPTQVRLIAAESGPAGVPALHAPVAFSKATGSGWELTPISNLDAVAFGNRQTEGFAWIFVIPADQRPRFLRVRNLRLPLPELKTDGSLVAELVGLPAAGAAPADAVADGGTPGATGTTLEGREGIMAGNLAESVELTARLPREISSNSAQGLRHQDGGILEGSARASKPPASLSRNTRIDRVHIPDHQGGVRLRITPDRARSLLGGARVAAASLQGVWIVDDRGDRYMPIGYSWLNPSSGEQEIKVDRNAPITSARQLPIQQLAPNDELYLYFAVPKGSKIMSYHIGDTTRQELTTPLSVN